MTTPKYCYDMKSWIVSAALMLPTILLSQVEVYPGPEGILPSDLYEVRVVQDGKTLSSFVYQNVSDDPADEHIRKEVTRGVLGNPVMKSHYLGDRKPELTNEGVLRQSVSFTNFSFNGDVSVSVKSLNGKIETAKILPISDGVEGILDGDSLTFEISEPLKLSVILNNDYLNPLHIFANPLELLVPKAGDEGVYSIGAGKDSRANPEALRQARVIRFEPGEHDVGIAFPVEAGQTIYLAGGSVLYGTIHGYMAQNVTIRGRGIISGEKIQRSTILKLKEDRRKNNWKRLKYHSINMLNEQNKTSWNSYARYAGEGCDYLTVEGVTLVDPGHFYLRLTGVPITIHNVKMVGAWHHNSDGVSTIGQANTTVFDCFFHCNDDAIYVRPDDVHIENCVFWQGSNGAVFQFSWGGDPYDQGGGFIHDIDIIQCDHVREANNRAIFGSRKSGPGDIRNIVFRDIRVEGPVWRVFRLTTWAEDEDRDPPGSIYDIVFENISIDGPVLHSSEIFANYRAPEGAGPFPGRVGDITFRNVTIGGTPITLDHFDLSQEGVDNIVIE